MSIRLQELARHDHRRVRPPPTQDRINIPPFCTLLSTHNPCRERSVFNPMCCAVLRLLNRSNSLRSLAAALLSRNRTIQANASNDVRNLPSGDGVLKSEPRKARTDGSEESARPDPPTRHVDPVRISTEGGPAIVDHCEVIVEDVLTIMVEAVGNITVMCTPTDTVALAVGFLFAEGMITSMEDIVRLTPRSDPLAIAIRLADPGQVVGGRNLIVTSSCGMCGSKNISSIREGSKPVGDTLRVSPEVLRNVTQQMGNEQDLFARTGATHAAVVFSADGEIIAMGEDIGRHNALDKAIGKCLLDNRPFRGYGTVLSGRISLEMLAKAVQAGLEIVAGVSAPTSLAIEVAQRSVITLCGFVREDRATVYTHPHRIQGIGELPD